ncbi:B-cell receptor CD22-like [Oncorhynchus nerka]|uniref:B-cell receptor CD22-like n=1 Tax=Oncorhynchus nerka TaxID=8023 RepID=UPI0031B7F583
MEAGIEPEDIGQDPEYAGRLEYHGDKKNDQTLRITDLRERDSATDKGIYSDIVFSPGLQVKVTGGHQGKTLTCITTCTLTDNPTYIWYKNGHKVKEDTSSLDSDSFSDADSYSCAVKGHEDLLSPAVYGPRNTSVSVSPSGEIVEGSSVTLTCSSDANPPVDKYTWYKKNVTSPKASGQSYSITNIISEDRGEYYCEAENKYGRLNSSSVSVDVQYGPKNTSVSVSSSGEIVEGSSVTLTCSSDANPPVDKYTWYFQNETFLNGCGQMYNISNFKSKDSGHYHCEAWNRRGSRNSTALMIIIPVLTAAVGITVVVLVLLLCLSGFMCFRKRASNSHSDTRDTADDGQGDSSPVYDNISSMAMNSTAAQTAATDDQDGVHYASVHFSRSRSQEVPRYSTVQLPQPQKQDQDVQYAAVKFNLPSAATQPVAAQAAEKDPSEIYSRINKPRTKKT